MPREDRQSALGNVSFPEYINRQHLVSLASRFCNNYLGYLQELKDLNKYNILAPCYHHPEIQKIEFSNSSLPQSFRRLGETDRPFPVRKRMAGRSWPLRLALKDGHVPMWPGLGGRSLPCTVCKLFGQCPSSSLIRMSSCFSFCMYKTQNLIYTTALFQAAALIKLPIRSQYISRCHYHILAENL